MSRAENYGLSGAELAALVKATVATNAAIREIVGAPAGPPGASLGEPNRQPAEPQQKRRYRMERDGLGHITAMEVVSGGRTRRLRFTRNSDGGFDVDEEEPGTGDGPARSATAPGGFR